MNYLSHHEHESIHTHWHAIHVCISIDSRGRVGPYVPFTVYGIWQFMVCADLSKLIL